MKKTKEKHNHGPDVHKKHAHPKTAHVHHHSKSVTEQNQRAVLSGLLFTFTFMIVEFVGGFLSGSLALVADAGHMLTDTFALGLSYCAFRFGRKAANSEKTFGYLRFEVLAGFINALTLLFLVLFIIYEAFERFMDPQHIHIGPMFVVAVLGFFVNIGVFFMVSRGDKSNLNIRGALLHVIGDLLGSVAVIAASIIIYFTGWMIVDPILSILVSMLILRSAVKLLRNATHILMEGTPHSVDLHILQDRILSEVKGIAAIRDIHVWSIASDANMATLVVQINDHASPYAIVEQIKKILSKGFSIHHSTIEVCKDKQSCALFKS